MESWAPLWNTIVNSSVWNRDTPDKKDVKIMWVTFLALKDKNGIVHSTLPGMKKDSGLTLEEAAHAIEVLESPDPLSNNKDFEGRRIQKIQDGWLVLNHRHYRDKIRLIQRKQYNAEKQKEYRIKRKVGNSPVSDSQFAQEIIKNGNIYQ
jgi:hypothetical protein